MLVIALFALAIFLIWKFSDGNKTKQAGPRPQPPQPEAHGGLPRDAPRHLRQPGASVSHSPKTSPEHHTLRGRCWVIDGDTIVINKVHIRISGIDAPELDHPWGNKAKRAMMDLCNGQIITAVTNGSVSHDRAVATCHLPDGRDLAAEMVKVGLALDWPKYSGGKYRELEPADARKRLWRADLRQKGKMPPTMPS